LRLRPRPPCFQCIDDGWEQPANPPRVEGQEAHSPGERFLHEQVGHQKPGEEEKGVNAEVSAGQPRHTGVEQHHNAEGDRSELGDVRAADDGRASGGAVMLMTTDSWCCRDPLPNMIMDGVPPGRHR
jgi:hypothetical protein